MKKLLNRIILLATVLVMALSFTACDFDLSSIFGDGNYSKKEITSESVSSIKSNITENTLNNLSYLKYESTYNYDYNKSGEYVYNTKYDVNMKVNGSAVIGEVFALIEFKTFYSQPDGLHGRDKLVKFCIVRTSSGVNYSDYTVYMNIDGQTYSASYSGMINRIEAADLWVSNTGNYPMVEALDYEEDQGAYFEVLYAYAEAVSGSQIVSTLDNPFIYCLHNFNKDNFIGILESLDEYSKNKGYSLYASKGNSYKIKRYLNDTKFLEKYDEESYLTINDDKTYSYKYEGFYETKNPARNFNYTTKNELKPFTAAIERPSWSLLY